MRLRKSGFTCGVSGPFTKNSNNNKKKKKKHEIQGIFIKTNQVKLGFNMACLMEILKIYIEEELQMEYYMIKHLILKNLYNMMDI